MKQKKDLRQEESILMDKIRDLECKRLAMIDIKLIIAKFDGKLVNNKRVITALEQEGFSAFGENFDNREIYRVCVWGKGVKDRIYLDLEHNFDFDKFSSSDMWYNRIDKDLQELWDAMKDLPEVVKIYNSFLKFAEEVESKFPKALNFKF